MRDKENNSTGFLFLIGLIVGVICVNSIDKWNGELPKVVGNSSNIFDVSSYLSE